MTKTEALTEIGNVINKLIDWGSGLPTQTGYYLCKVGNLSHAYFEVLIWKEDWNWYNQLNQRFTIPVLLWQRIVE